MVAWSRASTSMLAAARGKIGVDVGPALPGRRLRRLAQTSMNSSARSPMPADTVTWMFVGPLGAPQAGPGGTTRARAPRRPRPASGPSGAPVSPMHTSGDSGGTTTRSQDLLTASTMCSPGPGFQGRVRASPPGPAGAALPRRRTGSAERLDSNVLLISGYPGQPASAK